MNALITGFMPFGGESINPSWEAVSRIGTVPGVTYKRMCLPVIWDEAQDLLSRAILDLKPDCVLMVGQAGGRSGITLERVAINLQEASAPDNAGVLRSGVPVAEDGPAAYFTTLPHRAILARLQEAGIPASYSLSAGAYLCNTVMYRALHLAATCLPGMMAGFLHVPYLPEQSRTAPTLPLSTVVQALEISLKASAETWNQEKGEEPACL